MRPSSVSSQQWNLGQASGPLRTLSARARFGSVTLNTAFRAVCGDAEPPLRWCQAPRPHPNPRALAPSLFLHLPLSPSFCPFFPRLVLPLRQVLLLVSSFLVPYLSSFLSRISCLSLVLSVSWKCSLSSFQSLLSVHLSSGAQVTFRPHPKIWSITIHLWVIAAWAFWHYGNPWHIETWTLPTLTKCIVKSLKAPLQFILSFTRRPSSALM